MFSVTNALAYFGEKKLYKIVTIPLLPIIGGGPFNKSLKEMPFSEYGSIL